MSTTGRTRGVGLAKAIGIFLVLGWSWLSPSSASAQLGPPLSYLIVDITAPAPGSTVRGTVPVSATVTIVGTLTVVGVQFKVDGVNIGLEDTSAPYSVPWNT